MCRGFPNQSHPEDFNGGGEQYVGTAVGNGIVHTWCYYHIIRVALFVKVSLFICVRLIFASLSYGVGYFPETVNNRSILLRIYAFPL